MIFRIEEARQMGQNQSSVKRAQGRLLVGKQMGSISDSNLIREKFFNFYLGVLYPKMQWCTYVVGNLALKSA